MDWISTALLKDSPALDWPNLPWPADAQEWSETWELWQRYEWSTLFLKPWGQRLAQFAGAFTPGNLNPWVITGLAVLLVSWLAVPPYSWRRAHSAAKLFALAALIFSICVIVRFVTEPFPGSVWMPRYLGFIWPAFAIVVCALLMRLPTRPLRWGAIALLLIVNLGQHWGRVFAGSEPPVEQMAADVVSSQPPSDSRCYMDFSLTGPEPGEGAIFSPCGRYYLSILSGKPISPYELLPRRTFEQKFEIWTPRIIPPFELYVVNTIQDAPAIKRIIVWDNLRPGQVRTTDHIGQKLSGQWKLISMDEHHVRDHWTWKDLITARRRVYERKQAPATVSQPPPTTQLASP
jgi:hypothetical protein